MSDSNEIPLGIPTDEVERTNMEIRWGNAIEVLMSSPAWQDYAEWENFQVTLELNRLLACKITDPEYAKLVQFHHSAVDTLRKFFHNRATCINNAKELLELRQETLQKAKDKRDASSVGRKQKPRRITNTGLY